jgi:hypothetical protein
LPLQHYQILGIPFRLPLCDNRDRFVTVVTMAWARASRGSPTRLLTFLKVTSADCPSTFAWEKLLQQDPLGYAAHARLCKEREYHHHGAGCGPGMAAYPTYSTYLRAQGDMRQLQLLLCLTRMA